MSYIGKTTIAALLALALWTAPAAAQSISIPNTFVNGTVADATQVNANFTALANNALNRNAGVMNGTLTTALILPAVTATYDFGATGTRFKDGYFSGSVYDQNRTTPQGNWITVTFAGGNFTALGGGSWTVGSGDQVTFKYMLIGKTIWVAVTLDTSTVAGTVTSLQVAVPGGFSALVKTGMSCVIYDNSSTVPGAGLVSISAGTSQITLVKGDGANFTASTDNTYIRFVFAFEVT